MVCAVRNIEQALGDGRKIPSESESKNKIVARKSIVAKRNIFAGELFSEENIIAKRPGGGLNPMQWEQVIGCNAKRDFKEDEMISL